MAPNIVPKKLKNILKFWVELTNNYLLKTTRPSEYLLHFWTDVVKTGQIYWRSIYVWELACHIPTPNMHVYPPPTPQDGKTHYTELTVASMQLAQVGKNTVETRYPQLIFPPILKKVIRDHHASCHSVNHMRKRSPWTFPWSHQLKTRLFATQ